MENKMTDKISEGNPKLQGRVAQILNERELVINIGEINGVRKGMKFAILSESPLEVVDPVTHEKLDIIDREKVRVAVTEIRSKISICKTYRVKKIGGGMLYDFAGLAVMKGMLEPPQEINETLKSEDSSLPPPLSPEESYVKINDRVILVDE
jgi:hypothetical protein